MREEEEGLVETACESRIGGDRHHISMLTATPQIECECDTPSGIIDRVRRVFWLRIVLVNT